MVEISQKLVCQVWRQTKFQWILFIPVFLYCTCLFSWAGWRWQNSGSVTTLNCEYCLDAATSLLLVLIKYFQRAFGICIAFLSETRGGITSVFIWNVVLSKRHKDLTLATHGYIVLQSWILTGERFVVPFRKPALNLEHRGLDTTCNYSSVYISGYW